MGMCCIHRKLSNISSLGDYLWNDCWRGQEKCMCVRIVYNTIIPG